MRFKTTRFDYVTIFNSLDVLHLVMFKVKLLFIVVNSFVIFFMNYQWFETDRLRTLNDL